MDTPEYLRVVFRDTPHLYEALSQQFAGIQTVPVLLGRRRGERRKQAGLDHLERGRTDRQPLCIA
jgi:hypothetical protein